MKCTRCGEPAPVMGGYIPIGATCKCGSKTFGGIVMAGAEGMSGGPRRYYLNPHGEMSESDGSGVMAPYWITEDAFIRETDRLTAEAAGLRGERDAAVKALTRILVVCEHEADSAQDISRAEVGFWRDEIASITEALRSTSAAGGAREGEES